MLPSSATPFDVSKYYISLSENSYAIDRNL